VKILDISEKKKKYMTAKIDENEKKNKKKKISETCTGATAN